MSDVFFCPFFPFSIHYFSSSSSSFSWLTCVPFLFIGKLSQAYLLYTVDLMRALSLSSRCADRFWTKKENRFLSCCCMLLYSLSLSVSLATVHFLAIFCPFLCPCVCRPHTIGRRRSTVCHDMHTQSLCLGRRMSPFDTALPFTIDFGTSFPDSHLLTGICSIAQNPLH